MGVSRVYGAPWEINNVELYQLITRQKLLLECGEQTKEDSITPSWKCSFQSPIRPLRLWFLGCGQVCGIPILFHAALKLTPHCVLRCQLTTSWTWDTWVHTCSQPSLISDWIFNSPFRASVSGIRYWQSLRLSQLSPSTYFGEMDLSVSQLS